MAQNEPKKDEKRLAQETLERAARARRKRRLVIGGSALCLLAVAFTLAVLAVPRKLEHTLAGPFVAPLTPQKVQVNLSDGRSFLVLNVNVLYDAPSPEYFEARTRDAVCGAQVRDTLVALGSAKSRADVSDPALKPLFLEELRRAIEPLLFPVHIGATDAPQETDRASGLRPGLSSAAGTFRGVFGEHVLAVDAPSRTAQLDGGPQARFDGDEEDLIVTAPDGSTLHVDVSRLERGWRGEVAIGVRGRVRRMLLDELLIQ